MKLSPSFQALSNKGFTLIEVMVALAIFALSITALSTSFQANIHNAITLKEKTLAFWLAENRLVDLKAQALVQNQYPALGTRTEKVPYAERDWQVETAVSKAPGPFNMLRLDIRVAPESESKEPNYLIALSAFMVVKS